VIILIIVISFPTYFRIAVLIVIMTAKITHLLYSIYLIFNFTEDGHHMVIYVNFC